MQYALLLYKNEQASCNNAADPVLSEPCVKATVRLKAIELATTVRVHDGKAIVSDGPFAETKEILGGLIVIEAANMEEALAYADRAARLGATIEVRPMEE